MRQAQQQNPQDANELSVRTGTAGRLLRRRLGTLDARAQPARPRRRRLRPESRSRRRRRPHPEDDPRHSQSRNLHPRQLRPTNGMVPTRLPERLNLSLQHLPVSSIVNLEGAPSKLRLGGVLTFNVPDTGHPSSRVFTEQYPPNCESLGGAALENQIIFARHISAKHNQMKRFIITGAPGAGKTAIIRQLELDGFSVVEEAATDVIAAAQAQGTIEPWTHPSFIDAVANLQRDRQLRASYQPDEIQFHDRSAVCTAALAVYLGHPYTPFLPANWSASRKKQSTNPESSSFAISASSRPPKRGESALRKRCALKRFTKRLTETSASNCSQSSPEVVAERVSINQSGNSLMVAHSSPILA